MARALASQPEIVFADEPTGNLDSRTGAEILSFMRQAVRELGQTIVMVTHDPVAASYADRAVFLADGQIVDDLHRPDRRFGPRPHEDAGEALIMFRLTIKNLWAHKVRFALTGVAVVLGVAFMAGTMVLTDTMGKTFDNMFATSNAGIDVVVQQPETVDAEWRRHARAGPGFGASPRSVRRRRRGRRRQHPGLRPAGEGRRHGRVARRPRRHHRRQLDRRRHAQPVQGGRGPCAGSRRRGRARPQDRRGQRLDAR